MSDIEGDGSGDDLFHAVTMVEESTWKHGYTEGVEDGKKKGFDEGFKLGIQKGAELGKEVGFYAGFAIYILKTNEGDSSTISRLIKLCQSIVSMAKGFPSLDPRDEELTETLSQLHSKFKQIKDYLRGKLRCMLSKYGLDLLIESPCGVQYCQCFIYRIIILTDARKHMRQIRACFVGKRLFTQIIPSQKHKRKFDHNHMELCQSAMLTH